MGTLLTIPQFHRSRGKIVYLPRLSLIYHFFTKPVVPFIFLVCFLSFEVLDSRSILLVLTCSYETNIIMSTFTATQSPKRHFPFGRFSERAPFLVRLDPNERALQISARVVNLLFSNRINNTRAFTLAFVLSFDSADTDDQANFNNHFENKINTVEIPYRAWLRRVWRQTTLPSWKTLVTQWQSH